MTAWYLGVAQMVARYLGVVEAAGSNPVTQTNKNQSSERVADFLFIFMQNLNQRSLLVIPERLPRKRRASGDIGHLAMRRKAPSWLLVQIQSLRPIKKGTSFDVPFFIGLCGFFQEPSAAAELSASLNVKEKPANGFSFTHPLPLRNRKPELRNRLVHTSVFVIK